MLIIRTVEPFTGREYSDIVDERSRIPESAASVGSDNDLFYRHILEGHSWREAELRTFIDMVEPVATNTDYSRELLTVVVGVFAEDSRIGKVSDLHLIASLKIFSRVERVEPYLPSEYLVIPVKCTVQAQSKPVRIIYHVLIEQIGKCRMLACKIFRRSEIRVHILIVVVRYQGDVLRIVFIKRDADLEITVYRAVKDVRSPRIHEVLRFFQRIPDIIVLVIIHMPAVVGKHLSAKTAVLDGTYTETHLHTVVGHIKPTVGQVELKLLRLIHESVLVHIVSDDIA